MVDAGKRGHAVNVVSAAAFVALPNLASHSMTKCAVKMLGDCVRAELTPHGIGVSTICPGVIKRISSPRPSTRRRPRRRRRTARLSSMRRRRSCEISELSLAQVWSSAGSSSPCDLIWEGCSCVRRPSACTCYAAPARHTSVSLRTLASVHQRSNWRSGRLAHRGSVGYLE
ncbi:SDR family NAD(P)-dependent oxidoreductase [Tsukamurella tyrosinosolvens]|uniref:SDR family NAD(P)-dependent oxidoreductase n=1 Tax=Tsukamurella tyrosinosolvens TaxID=57704 RepID=UPI00398C17CA